VPADPTNPRGSARPKGPAATASHRAAIYARVSTGSQVEGTSLESQRDQCRAAAKLNGCTVTGEYVDAGVSGAKDSRPALDELLAAASAGQIEVVVIAKLDRLGRSLLHLLTLMQRLDALGVRVVSASDNIDTKTPAGRMMLQLLGVFAEFERERIRERSRDGARRRVEDGGFVCSIAPFGYRAVPDPSGRRGVVLDIEPAQARCIREIYRLLIGERTPIARAAQTLNASGHRTATGAQWTPDTLARWARGHTPATAAGLWRWNDLTVDIPAILTPEQASQWAAWRADTAVQQSDHGSYLLGGRVATPCGGRYHGRTVGSQTPVYACRRRLRTKASDPQRCGCVSIRVSALDEAVWSEIRTALTRPTALAALAREAAGAAHPQIGADTLGARIADAAEAIADIQRRIADEYQAAREDGFDAATARMMVQPLHTELKRSQADLSRLGKARAALTRLSTDNSQLQDVLDRVRGRIDDLDVEGKNQVLDALCVEVKVAGYEPCTECGGTGYQAMPAGVGRRWPPSCSSCQRMRQLPVVDVRITAPEALLDLVGDPQHVAAIAG
jgi:site-specific DNA recombinase